MNVSTGVTVMITPREKALVVKIAGKIYKRYCPAGKNGQIELEELIHLGIIGLLDAKKRFDMDRGVPFPVYASTRIRGAMLDQIRTQPIVRTSQELARKINELKKARERFSRKGHNPDDRQLAEKLGWSVEEVRQISSQAVRMVQVRENVQKDDDDRSSWGEIVRDDGPGAEEMVIKKELAADIQECLERLPSNELRMVLLARVLEGIKLKELAETMSCSLQTVANRQETAQALMKDCLKKHGWTAKEFCQLYK